MIGSDEVRVIFAKKRPGLKIIKIGVYDNDNYIIEAVEDSGKVDYNSPFYLLNKNSGVVSPFSPISNLPKFHAAFRDNLISPAT